MAKGGRTRLTFGSTGVQPLHRLGGEDVPDGSPVSVAPSAAAGARSGGGRPTVDVNHPPALLLDLALQHGSVQSPPGIGSSPGQLAVLRHPRYVRLLRHNRPVLTDAPGAELMEMIQPLVRHLQWTLASRQHAGPPLLEPFTLRLRSRLDRRSRCKADWSNPEAHALPLRLPLRYPRQPAPFSRLLGLGYRASASPHRPSTSPPAGVDGTGAGGAASALPLHCCLQAAGSTR